MAEPTSSSSAERGPNERGPNERGPNLIWIFGDQHRGQALSYRGDPNVQTPNLDRLAVEGLTFASAVSGSPLCCPYRGSLLSGRYPHHCVPGHQYPMPPDQPTVAHAFKEHGYRTSYFGKWHVDGHKEKKGRPAFHIVPPERRGGFDDWLGYENNNAQWDCWVHGRLDDQDIEMYRLPGFETDKLTDLMIEYLNARARGQAAAGDTPPFFAVLSVQPPHDPYQAPREWMQRHNPARLRLRPNVPQIARVVEQARRELAGYYALIENLDWNVGRIMDCLDESGLIENTHVIFFSDHGDMHGSHGQFRKTDPREESLRVPFIVAGAGRSRNGRRGGQTDYPINHVDIAPTSLGLCGITPPDWMPGTDYSSLRLGGETPSLPESAYLQAVIPTRHHNSVDRPWRGVVTRDGWKYAILAGQPWMLFNLNEDPYEQANLALNTRFSHEREKLQEQLAEWIKRTGDEFQLPEL